MSALRALVFAPVAVISACGAAAAPGAGTSPASVQLTAAPGLAPVAFVSTPEGQPISVGGERRCVTPCTLYVTPGRFRYQASDTSVPQAGFLTNVPPAGLDVRVRFVPGWRAPTGLGLAILGGSGLGVGLLTAVASVFVNDGKEQTPEGKSILYGATVAMGAGAAPLVPAIILLTIGQAGVESEAPRGAASGATPGQANPR